MLIFLTAHTFLRTLAHIYILGVQASDYPTNGIGFYRTPNPSPNSIPFAHTCTHIEYARRQ